MSKLLRSYFVFAIIVSLCITGPMYAQGAAQVGTVSGEVVDDTGASLPGVTVELLSVERGFKRSAITDNAGRYRFAAVPNGRYTVTALLSGFDTVQKKDNAVMSDKNTDVHLKMKLGAMTEAITVTGELPLVDRTNTTANTTMSSKEFEQLPVGRSYQSLANFAPGVEGGPNQSANPSVNGATSGQNQFLFDGVDTTDPTTGTFGSNLNFEAIQEVTVLTSGLSAEYGRSVGGIISVVTKSGGNDLEGSAKYIATNDEWNGRNKVSNQVSGVSLARTKFDQVNPRYSFTLGGPVMRDRIWFFGAFERSDNTTAQRQTLNGENYQQTTVGKFPLVRLTAQLTPSHSLWAKYSKDPIDGFVNDYWTVAAERSALTSQNQGGNNKSLQWTGIFGTDMTAEAFAAKNTSILTVSPFELSSLHNGAPHESLDDGFVYNGATFDGYTDRPRDQFIVAASLFKTLGATLHDVKGGVDYQKFQSASQFGYPANQYYIDETFDAKTRTFTPDTRLDFDEPEASTSEGKVTAIYLRDKVQLGQKLFVEAGARYEKQTGKSDIGSTTVDVSTIAPRLSASFDMRGDGRQIVLGTYGRVYQYIIQGFSDDFAAIPQQSNYDVFVWNPATKAYEFETRVDVGGSSQQANTDLNPTYVDEFTIGYQQQFGNVVGLGVRLVSRKFGDLIDDVLTIGPDGSQTKEFVNYGAAERKYNALQFTFEKRFSRHWNALASYTRSKTEGNHFASYATTLGDFLNSDCRTGIDPSVGTNGTIPCSTVNDGANKTGRAATDRPDHIKGVIGYQVGLGPVNLALGVAADWLSGLSYQPQRTVSVLIPGTTRNAGPTATYFYEPRGSRRLSSIYNLDASLEATYRIFRDVEVGLKGEAFNFTDQQEQITVSNTTFCTNTTNPSASCNTARKNFGTATTRGAFQTPRSFRLTALVRF